mgnify:FL=1|jgi:hypothetical protein
MIDEKSLLETESTEKSEEIVAPAPKKRGRKPGSKNLPKTENTEKETKARGRKPKSEAEKAASGEAKKKPGRPSLKEAAKNTEPKTNVTIEYEGRAILTKDVLARAVKAYKKAHRGVVIKKVDLYIKPEENTAYYVINGDMSPSYRVEL